MEMNPEYPDADRPTVFEEGIEFEDFIADLFSDELGIALSSYKSKHYQISKGENKQGIEVKLDNRILETKKVSIEVAEKSSAASSHWIPSGIFRRDNTWLYVQGNPDIVFVFGKNILRLVYEKSYKEKVWEPKPTIKTFLMPIEEAKRIALKIIYPKKKNELLI